MVIDNPETQEQLVVEINSLLDRISDLVGKHIGTNPKYTFRSPQRIIFNRLINVRNQAIVLKANLNGEIKPQK
jgi:hypothetical protein